MIQAIVGMWRKVGVDASIEVYEIAKHYRTARRATSWPPRPSTTGAIRSATRRPPRASRCSATRRTRRGAPTIVDALIGPLWGERDEAKRIAGWKAVDRYVAENALVLPLLQYVQPIVHKTEPEGGAAYLRGAAAAAVHADVRRRDLRGPPLEGGRPFHLSHAARRILLRSASGADPRRGGGAGVCAGARRSRRSGRDDDPAGRGRCRRRAAARAVRPRQAAVAAVRDLGRPGPDAAILASPSPRARTWPA